jgi:hypothetical protein
LNGLIIAARFLYNLACLLALTAVGWALATAIAVCGLDWHDDGARWGQLKSIVTATEVHVWLRLREIASLPEFWKAACLGAALVLTWQRATYAALGIILEYREAFDSEERAEENARVQRLSYEIMALKDKLEAAEHEKLNLSAR